MRNKIRGAAALATAAAAVLTLGGTAEARPADWDRCPDGAVCIYPEGRDPQTDPSVNPTDVFWSYGAHNLRNQVGHHWVYNNQTGGATANLCTQYNGGGCGDAIPAGVAVYADLTPINSVRLNRP